MNRYHRQILLPGIGESGQSRLQGAHVLIVGVGALGTVIADTLARAGVGKLTLVDRDIVEITNLQRQTLFDEDDVSNGLPKAVAAKNRLAAINSEITIDAIVADFNHTNAASMMKNVDVILDGLDNFQTRYLLNDCSVKYNIPYCYGGAVGTSGMAGVFQPVNQSLPCLRCLFPEAPPPGSSPTCDTAGVLASAVAIVAHHQSTQAIKLIIESPVVDCALITLDIWQNEYRRMDVRNGRRDDCVCCQQHNYEFLEGSAGQSSAILCGRDAVQILPDKNATQSIDLQSLVGRLQEHGQFTFNQHLIRGSLYDTTSESRPIQFTIFSDGRVLIHGTDDTTHARTLYNRYIGG